MQRKSNETWSSASQWLGGVPQMVSLDRFRMHHPGGSQLDLRPDRPGPGDEATGLSSSNPPFLLTGWGSKWIVTCAPQHNKSLWEKEAKERGSKNTHSTEKWRESLLTGRNGSMSWPRELRKTTKIVPVTVAFILMIMNLEFELSPGWQEDEIEYLTHTTSQVASNVLKMFTGLMWPNCDLTELKLRSPTMTPGIDTSCWVTLAVLLFCASDSQFPSYEEG